MAQAFLYGNGSGNGTGGILTVTAPAGDTVTISKDGKTKTKTADSSGQAVFKSLKAGTWTVTISNGSQTATKTVNVVTDYAVTMTYFSATIAVTWPEGSTCTCSDGSTTLTAPTLSGSYTFTVPNAGSWTVSCTDGTDSDSETVTITTDGESQSVELNYRFYIFQSGVGAVVPLTYYTGKNGQYEVDEDKITITYIGDGSGAVVVRTTSTVDLSDYAKMCVVAKITDIYDKWGGGVGVSKTAVDDKNNLTDLSGLEASVKYVANSEVTTYTVDISQINGMYYCAAMGEAKGEIYSIYLSE